MKPRSLLFTLAMVTVGCGDTAATLPPGTVLAHDETEPSGNDPDDVAIWIHPSDPSRSLIIGTDKGLGIFLYALDGSVVHSLLGTAPNNVDLRHLVELGGTSLALATAVDRNTDTLFAFGIDDAGEIVNVTRGNEIEDFGDLYGSCMYRSSDGTLYAFVNAKSGAYRQYRIDTDDAEPVIQLTLVRSFALTSQPEGCVADDLHGVLYLGEEDGGLFRIGAEPDDGSLVETVDLVGDGRLVADVEGMTIYPTADGGGYLLVSSQGSDEYIVYERRTPNAYVTRFRIGEGPEHDAATDTDGIDVTPLSLGDEYPEGLFVAQDDHDSGFSRNFKLVRWGDIAHGAELPLVVDTSVSPRAE